MPLRNAVRRPAIASADEEPAVATLERIDSGIWLETARRCERATFFHTPYWAEAARAAGPWRVQTLGGRLVDGTAFAYPLLRFQRRLRWLGRFASTFAGCYGGPIATRPLSAGEAAALHDLVRMRCGSELTVTLGPFPGCAEPPRGFGIRRDATHVLELPDEFDAVLTGFTKGHRQVYRRGLRRGLSVRLGGTTDVDAYVRMHEDKLRRWGDRATGFYPAALFDRLGRMGADHPELVRLWVAELEGRMIAALWAFYWNRHVVMWHSASYDVERVRPDTPLQGEVIRDAVERGYRWFDFNPSAGDEGAAAFKRRFGTTALPVIELHASTRAHRMANRAASVARPAGRRQR